MTLLSEIEGLHMQQKAKHRRLDEERVAGVRKRQADPIYSIEAMLQDRKNREAIENHIEELWADRRDDIIIEMMALLAWSYEEIKQLREKHLSVLESENCR